jgi:hypothetical protein
MGNDNRKTNDTNASSKKSIVEEIAIFIIVILAAIVIYYVFFLHWNSLALPQPTSNYTTIASILPKTPTTSSIATTTLVAIAPKVAISSPKNVSTVNGPVDIIANISDNVGIKDVQFFIGNSLYATVNSPPFEYVWNATGPQKLYIITVNATDNSGLTGSASIVVDLGGLDHGK